MSGALAFCLSASGIGIAAAAYLHAASAYLDNATVKLQQLPALWLIYYRVMISVLTKPRRLRSQRTALPQMSITTGVCLCRCTFLPDEAWSFADEAMLMLKNLDTHDACCRSSH